MQKNPPKNRRMSKGRKVSKGYGTDIKMTLDNLVFWSMHKVTPPYQQYLQRFQNCSLLVSFGQERGTRPTPRLHIPACDLWNWQAPSSVPPQHQPTWRARRGICSMYMIHTCMPLQRVQRVGESISIATAKPRSVRCVFFFGPCQSRQLSCSSVMLCDAGLLRHVNFMSCIEVRTGATFSGLSFDLKHSASWIFKPLFSSMVKDDEFAPRGSR